MTYIHESEILTSLIQLQKMPHVLDVTWWRQMQETTYLSETPGYQVYEEVQSRSTDATIHET